MVPRKFTVDAALDGLRLDQALARLAVISRREARLLIAQGNVRLAGKTVRVHSRAVRAGQTLSVAAASASTAPGSPAPLRVLHLDRAVIAVDKPPGLLSEADRRGAPSIETRVPELLAALGEDERVWLVHRLDAPTSGVLILARTAAASRRLGEVFRQGAALKTYWALCAGELAARQEINAPIARLQGSRQAVRDGGKPAATIVRPLRHRAEASLVEATPRTGRTHQIRVHLAHLGHPLFGDRLYGGPMYAGAARQPVGRVMLHARRLSLPHPETGRRLSLAADVPEDFAALATSLALGPVEPDPDLG